MYSEAACTVATLLTLLDGALASAAATHAATHGQPATTGAHGTQPQQLPDVHVRRLFLYCVAWGLGGLLDARDRPALDGHLRSLASEPGLMPDKVQHAHAHVETSCALFVLCA